MSRLAFLWTKQGGMISLGTLGGKAVALWTSTRVARWSGGARRPAGRCTRSCGRRDGGVDLGTLGLHNASAAAVNERGDVLVVGTTESGTHAFRRNKGHVRGSARSAAQPRTQLR